MIARVWRGLTRAQDAADYAEYVQRTGIAAFETTPGNGGSMILYRVQGDTAEFVVLSLWDSYESIEAFAGATIERAMFYEEDDRYLLERDFYASHYIVAGQSAGPGPG